MRGACSTAVSFLTWFSLCLSVQYVHVFGWLYIHTLPNPRRGADCLEIDVKMQGMQHAQRWCAECWLRHTYVYQCEP